MELVKKKIRSIVFLPSCFFGKSEIEENE